MLVTLLVLISAIGKAGADIVSDKFDYSVFKRFQNKFWNYKKKTWKRKNSFHRTTKLGRFVSKMVGEKTAKYLFETVLVVFTDAWHMFDNVRTLALLAALVFASGIHFIFGLAMVVLYIATFHVLYKYVFLLKDYR